MEELSSLSRVIANRCGIASPERGGVAGVSCLPLRGRCPSAHTGAVGAPVTEGFGAAIRPPPRRGGYQPPADLCPCPIGGRISVENVKKIRKKVMIFQIFCCFLEKNIVLYAYME